MKAIFFAALSFSVLAQAAPSIKDASFLGQYNLVKADSKSELQSAKLVYNHSSTLVIQTDRNEDEYELSEPNKDGVIASVQGEPNCDGGEDVCTYDAEVVIKLLPGVNDKNETVPQLSIEITTDNAFDDSGNSQDTQTYILNWTNKLDDAIPYYVEVETPADIKAIAAQCSAALAKIQFDDKVSYLNSNDVCPHPTSVVYRDSFDTAFKALKNEWVGEKQMSKIKLLTPAQVKSEIFNKAKALARKYTGKVGGTVTAKDIVAQIEKIEGYVKSKDKVYAYPSVRGMAMFVVDSKAQTIVQFDIRTTTEYAK